MGATSFIRPDFGYKSNIINDIHTHKKLDNTTLNVYYLSVSAEAL
jgi:hypothetical protein